MCAHDTRAEIATDVTVTYVDWYFFLKDESDKLS